MVREPRGAGRGGGLLFLAVLAFVAYLAVQSTSGTPRWLLAAAFCAAIVVLTLRVFRRR